MPAQRDNGTNRGFVELAATVSVLLSMAALLAVAFKFNDSQQSIASTASAGAAPMQQVRLVIKSDEERAKMGPDGNWHDAFLPADFSVKAGATVRVTIYNYDDMPHTFTANGLGLNVMIPGGSESAPGKRTFVLRAPTKPGRYGWFCAMPCDPWAMAHVGYMKGYVRVTRA